MALSVPEFVAYREVREVIVDHLAAEELPTGSPKRWRLEQLARELGQEIACAELSPAEIERYYEGQAAGGRELAADPDRDRLACELLDRQRLRTAA